MRILIVAVLIGMNIAAAVAAEESDETVFKRQVAACNTTECLADIAYVYVRLMEMLQTLQAYPLNETLKKKYEADIAYTRTQLRDDDWVKQHSDALPNDTR